ncbi:SGNH/GDSL hydrolase family protein [Butyrivibrio sp. FCS014]|uniref:SGNH/GDSL hydrolase family protein n=1 Tax=Butyrivibrio sp. FCS014 TaxID=1408304 RepID=UPI00046414E7|nr:SGNH/GDSL hydrolase family protein [Butyrivibrio sp. FCS014]
MKKNRFLIEIIVFCLFLSLAVSGLYNVLRYKNVGSGGGMDNFYSTKVPIDVIVFGSSHAACTVNNGILWEENGVASYSLTAGSQEGDGTAYFVREAIAVNKPKVALIETYLLPGEEFSLASYYRSALTSRFSTRYVDYTMRVAGENDLDREMVEDMLLRMPIVHSRYKELEPKDFGAWEEYIMGYRGSDQTVPIEPIEFTDEKALLSEVTLRNIDDIISSCRQNDVEPVFFAAPYLASSDEQAKQNAIRDYVEAKECKYIDFIRDYQKYNIDFSRDFRDDGHLNDEGASKVTRALGEILVSNYDIPDRRGCKGYEMWDKHLTYLEDRKAMYVLHKISGLQEYLECLRNMADDYTVVIALNGNYRALGDDIYMPYITELGIDQESYEKGGVWIIRNGFFEDYSDGASNFKKYSEIGGVDFNFFKTENEEFPHIIVGEQDYTPEYNGISILVFDEKCGYVIDNMYVDIYKGVEVEHTNLEE